MMRGRHLPIRKSILLVAALAILAAIGVTLWEDDASPITHRHPRKAEPPHSPGSDMTDVTDEATDADAPPVDIFAVRTWEPPPPPPPPPAPPPPPQAPPLPFRFIGRIAGDQETAYLLATSERVIPVRVGDIIDERYLVDKFEAGQLHLIYRPLQIRQTLFVGTGS